MFILTKKEIKMEARWTFEELLLNEFNKGTGNFELKEHEKNGKKSISVMDGDDDKNLCIEIAIDAERKHISLMVLQQCAISGSSSLINVIKFGYKYHFETCSLKDQSKLNFVFTKYLSVKINLKYLYLLTIGDTWYGTFGFKNKKIEDNRLFDNFKIQIQKSVDQVLSEAKDFLDYHQKNGFENMVRKTNTFDDLNLEEPVQSLFQRLKDELRTMCVLKNCPASFYDRVKYIRDIINFMMWTISFNIVVSTEIVDRNDLGSVPFPDIYDFITSSIIENLIDDGVYTLELKKFSFNAGKKKRRTKRKKIMKKKRRSFTKR
jgi:hypothetical protein